MIAELYEQYKEYRKLPGSRPEHFKIWLKGKDQKPLKFKTDRQGHPQANWKQDGFELSAKVETDDDTDVSYLGKFVDQWEFGAIKVEGWGRRQYPRFFVPATTVKEHREGLQGMGYSKGIAEEMARSHVHADLKLAKSYGDTWDMMQIIVQVMKEGVTLWSARIGGICHDDDLEWSSIAKELAVEAIEEAKETLERLCCKKVG